MLCVAHGGALGHCSWGIRNCHAALTLSKGEGRRNLCRRNVRPHAAHRAGRARAWRPRPRWPRCARCARTAVRACTLGTPRRRAPAGMPGTRAGRAPARTRGGAQGKATLPLHHRRVGSCRPARLTGARRRARARKRLTHWCLIVSGPHSAFGPSSSGLPHALRLKVCVLAGPA